MNRRHATAAVRSQENRGVLAVSNRRPFVWDEWATQATNFAVTPQWLEAIGPVVPGMPHWLIYSVEGVPRLGLHVRLLDAPPGESRYDIEAVLRGDIPTLEPRMVTAPPDQLSGTCYPAVLAMLPGWTCGAVGPGAAEPDTLAAALEAVNRWAYSVSARSVSFLYIPDSEHALNTALLEFGARPVELYPSCEMALDFTTIDEYRNQLSHGRRQDLRRLRRRIYRAGLVIGAEELAFVRDQVLELRLSFLRKFGLPADRAMQARTLGRILSRYSPEDRVFNTVRQGERIVAFSLSLRHGPMLRAVWWGREPQAYGAYFVLLFDELVEQALRLGVTRIDYGTLNWQDKVSFGCRLVHLQGLIWRPRAETHM
ncbi:hypothetical protein GCM10023319_73830 [Nocardia iowensis]